MSEMPESYRSHSILPTVFPSEENRPKKTVPEVGKHIRAVQRGKRRASVKQSAGDAVAQLSSIFDQWRIVIALEHSRPPFGTGHSAFPIRPTVVASLDDAIDFFPSCLACVVAIETFGLGIEGKPLGISQPHRIEFRPNGRRVHWNAVEGNRILERIIRLNQIISHNRRMGIGRQSSRTHVHVGSKHAGKKLRSIPWLLSSTSAADPSSPTVK